jgi:hypothetical protein
LKVKKILKNEDKTYIIDCEFGEEEFNTIMEIGINVLLANGALAYQATDEEDTFEVISPNMVN